VPFLPSVFEAKGWSASEYGSVTSSYWIAGAFVGVITGKLADRFGNRRLIAATLLLSAPTFWLLPHTEGAGALVVALFMGGLSGASHSIIVAEGQRLMPARRGFASGAVLGFIFGAGAVGTFIIGVVADAYGLVSAFQLAAASVVVAALLAWRLLEARPAPTATELVALPESGLRRS
jgi:FSR family fosmidomycin resistance protein-like MFS transporter